jgi:TonB family protein
MRNLALLLLAACATAPRAETGVPVFGGIGGTVVDASSGSPVSGAYVLAVGSDKATSGAETGADGSFLFSEMSGSYDLLVEKDGFASATARGLAAQPGQDVMLKVALHPGTPSPSTEFAGVLRPPVLISGPEPVLTPEAREHHIEGTVAMKCTVTIEGAVQKCRVLQSVRYMDAAAVVAQEARRYRPAMVDGKPVEVKYLFRVDIHQ